jgi:ATP phosphoribosyltransferase regulatory subunit
MEAVRAALNRRDGEGVREAWAQTGATGNEAKAICSLLTLSGGPEVLAEAERLSNAPGVLTAIARLRAIHAAVARRGLADHVTFDLGETRGMGYYTGMAFEGFAPGLGFPLCGGGRYDELIGRYGVPRPAVGVALLSERVRLALNGAAGALARPDLLVASGVACACWQEIEHLRQRGWRVEADVLVRSEAELRELARARGIPRLAVRAEGGQVCIVTEGDERWLTWEALAEVPL